MPDKPQVDVPSGEAPPAPLTGSADYAKAPSVRRKPKLGEKKRDFALRPGA